MKKLGSLLLAITMVGSLVACDAEEQNVTQDENENVEVQDLTDDVEEDEVELEETTPAEAEEESQTVSAHEDDHHHDDLPFEWAGSYNLIEGTYSLVFKQNEFGDESILVAFILEDSNIKDLEHHAAHIMEASGFDEISEGEQFSAESEFAYNLFINVEGATSFTFTVIEAGTYRIFTEHHAEEFDMEISNEAGDVMVVENAKEYEGHEHGHSH
ncbi:hypothetical protein H1D32_03515 [Anaerobacillus sp. CMMVII]|uniref:hypothetical protein n=1 Tax=Anaerobacillus sp. CMMVII TaxID=2755588 RepID=UPI0021B7283B|nr:hypothetical protein [Anaerobacillus sp. CMMVII]MCT8136904.1 hypothetical protein [Anaerobacillus sp. CMMVII]